MRTNDREATGRASNNASFSRRNMLLAGTTIAAVSALAAAAPVRTAQAQQKQQPAPTAGGKRPNILVIFGDDIGQTNVSAYSLGLMGYRTPNIDRIAREGMMFTDYYAEQSCTAGRSTFITGQCTLRTGLSKVGIPARPSACRRETRRSPSCSSRSAMPPASSARTTSATATSILPTVHGFDEFFGNLYHLNAEEDPENRIYPRDPAFRQKFGPRGVLRCKASDRDDPTEHPRWGKVGRQTIEDTGPLTKKRMETIDDETSAAAIDFIAAPGEGQQAVLLLVQLHPHALPHACARRPSRQAGPDRADRVRRRHDRARRR